MKAKPMPSITMTIHLNQIEDLFAPPQVDPFHERYHVLSGIGQVASALQAKVPRDGLHVIFVLPDSAPKVEKAAVQAAIVRYCDVMITNTQAELDARRQVTQRNLGVGMGILAASLGLAASVTRMEFLSAPLQNLLSNSISILGTVALWSPVDALLFALRPLRRTIRIYSAIKAMTFEIQGGR